MKTTTTVKIAAAAAALLITLGTVHHFTQPNPTGVRARQPQREKRREAGRRGPESAPVPAANSERAEPPGTTPPRAQPASPQLRSAAVYDDAAKQGAREKQEKFLQRLGQLALMEDAERVGNILFTEYGIRISVDEIRSLQTGGQKGFTFGLIELWATRQPQEALAWAASVLPEPNGSGDLQRVFLDAARKSLPHLDREALDGMLPDGPGRSNLLDLADAGTDPVSLANRILAVPDSAERISQLRSLAKGWGNEEEAVDWARRNLSGTERNTFYEELSYELAHKNPQTALGILAELKGTESYASTLGRMMRGLVQIGGLGREAAELIAGADVNPSQRADLISELARRWVRNDPDAAVAWANSLTAPEDFRAAIPLLVSQLDNDRVSHTVESYLKNADPVMELALIEAAAPPGLAFDPEKSRLILDPLIRNDSGTQLAASEGSGSGKAEMLWSSVNQTAKRLAEVGEPAEAMGWLASLPFAEPSDYAKAIANVLTVWNLKSETEASGWLQSAALNPSLKAAVLKAAQP